MVEVEAKATFAHCSFESAVGSGDDADVDGQLGVSADTTNEAALEHVEELGREIGREIGRERVDVVEKQGAVLRGDEEKSKLRLAQCMSCG